MKISCSNSGFFSAIHQLKDGILKKCTSSQVVGIVGVVASIAMTVFGALMLQGPSGFALAVGGLILLQASAFPLAGFSMEDCFTLKEMLLS